jgi:hypothetical protein
LKRSVPCLSFALLCAGCNSATSPAHQVIDATSQYYTTPNTADSLTELQTALKNRNINDYIAASLAVADTECGVYLNSLGKLEQRLQFSRQENGIVAAVTAAVMGLTRTAGPEIAGAAVGFGLIDSSLGAYQTNYVFGPDVGALQNLINGVQGPYKSTMKDHPPASFAEAVAQVEGYETICQTQSIRHLVNQAVASQTFSADFVSGLGPGATATKALYISHLTISVGSQAALTSSDLAVLYWMEELATTATEKTTAAKQFQAGKNAAVNYCAAPTGTPPTPVLQCDMIKADIDAINGADNSVSSQAKTLQATSKLAVNPADARLSSFVPSPTTPAPTLSPASSAGQIVIRPNR